MSERTRYAVVGTGGRSNGFIEALASTYRDQAELVAFCDLSRTRMDYYNERLREEHGLEPAPAYPAADFERLIRERKPDTVMVTTPDATHHLYASRAMELGCDVICEKPMTTDAARARLLLETVQRTGRSLRVIFNMRYNPMAVKVKQLLQAGVVGTPLAAELHWLLDTRHGADYFRRWHATKANSGGLLVHKATHHFDMMNWWLEDWPETVFAMGDLRFYGKENARRRGETYDYERYTGHPQARRDPFGLQLDQTPRDRRLYLEAEQDSGYVRDRNVFGEHVDIEDTMGVLVRYRGGVPLTYSLLAYSPWEGFRMAITGTRGRLELVHQKPPHRVQAEGDAVHDAPPEEEDHLRCTVYPMFGEAYDAEIPTLEGGHGGADPRLYQHLFAADPPPDPLGQAAGPLDGAASILIGISANESIATGRPIPCDELVELPPRPPSSDEFSPAGAESGSSPRTAQPSSG